MQAAASAAPGATVQMYATKYSWSQLLAIANDVATTMASDTTGTIASVTPDPSTNKVQVGVTNVNSPVAQAVTAQYGDAIDLFDDQPIEPLSASATQERPNQSTELAAAASTPYPDRAKYHQPGYAGPLHHGPPRDPGRPKRSCVHQRLRVPFRQPERTVLRDRVLHGCALRDPSTARDDLEPRRQILRALDAPQLQPGRDDGTRGRGDAHDQ